MRVFAVIVDTCADYYLGHHIKPGDQSNPVNGKDYMMDFDSQKRYFRTQKHTDQDLSKYPIIELTCSLTINFRCTIYAGYRVNSHHMSQTGELACDIQFMRSPKSPLLVLPT